MKIINQTYYYFLFIYYQLKSNNNQVKATTKITPVGCLVLLVKKRNKELLTYLLTLKLKLKNLIKVKLIYFLRITRLSNR